MSDTTIFKLSDLGSFDLFENHTIKVKSKKSNKVSCFSNIINYTAIPHYNVTVNNMYSNPSGGNVVELYDGTGDNRESRGTVAYNSSKTVPIAHGEIYTSLSNVTFMNPATQETANPYTIVSDITLNLVTEASE